MQRLPAAEAKLISLNADRTDAMLHMLKLFKDVSDFAHKRLTTTVEEDRSISEHCEDVRIREEKAVSEKLQLQQELRLDRLQRQRQATRLQTARDTATGQLEAMTAGHAAETTRMRAAAHATQATARETFLGCAPCGHTHCTQVATAHC